MSEHIKRFGTGLLLCGVAGLFAAVVAWLAKHAPPVVWVLIGLGCCWLIYGVGEIFRGD